MCTDLALQSYLPRLHPVTRYKSYGEQLAVPLARDVRLAVNMSHLQSSALGTLRAPSISFTLHNYLMRRQVSCSPQFAGAENEASITPPADRLPVCSIACSLKPLEGPSAARGRPLRPRPNLRDHTQWSVPRMSLFTQN